MIKVIENFLPHNEAVILSNNIYNTPSNWWTYAYRHNESKNVVNLGDNLFGQNRQRAEEEKIRKTFQAGNFAYKFRRSTSHIKDCSCYECTFNKEHLLKDVRDTVIKYSNLENPYIFETFISAYSPGDFLSTHTDENRGVAFIYNLTQNWLPEYGGCLHLLGEEPKVIYPKFNALVLMQLGDKGVPHFVSEVSSYAPHARVAVSGWYNES